LFLFRLSPSLHPENLLVPMLALPRLSSDLPDARLSVREGFPEG
jgi:hypothetical protein